MPVTVFGLTGPDLAFQIGHERRPEGGMDVDDAIGERLGLLPVGRRGVKDPRMEQHPVGATQGRSVVTPPLAGLEPTASRGPG